mmetsp:Transcript_33975/g.102624  ORF Transcript_33975/g.102624 Transcript_33975/m.102624 type:complete len:265 (-) Transcript_33975:537-1331(-)
MEATPSAMGALAFTPRQHAQPSELRQFLQVAYHVGAGGCKVVMATARNWSSASFARLLVHAGSVLLQDMQLPDEFRSRLVQRLPVRGVVRDTRGLLLLLLRLPGGFRLSVGAAVAFAAGTPAPQAASPVLLQQLVALLHGLERLLGLVRAAVFVGVHGPGEAPVRVVQLLVGGLLTEAEKIIAGADALRFVVGLPLLASLRPLHEAPGELVHQAVQLSVAQRSDPRVGLVDIVVEQRRHSPLAERPMRSIVIPDDRLRHTRLSE